MRLSNHYFLEDADNQMIVTPYLIPEPVEGPTDVYDCKFTQYEIGLWCNI